MFGQKASIATGLLLMVLSVTSTIGAQDVSSDFVLDPSKPYVYIKFDHFAFREPLREGEVPRGLWLRLVNNCRVPIEVLGYGFTDSNDETGVLLQTEVVSAKPTMMIFEGVPHAQIEPVVIPVLGQEEPPATRSETESASLLKQEEEEMPKGYAVDFATLLTIPPGEDLLFSVPVNHVQPSWYLRVRFNLQLSLTSALQPLSYVTFSWRDIPEEHRKNARP